jgi:hypothetical protein
MTFVLLPCGARLRRTVTQPARWEAFTVIWSLVYSARMNGHDPYAYLKDVLERLPTQPKTRIQELLAHRWTVSE